MRVSLEENRLTYYTRDLMRMTLKPHTAEPTSHLYVLRNITNSIVRVHNITRSLKAEEVLQMTRM